MQVGFKESGRLDAITKALSEGERDFESITVVGAPKGAEPIEECMPCGYCRQFMNEYASDDFKIYTYDEEQEKLYEYTIDDLLPEDFKDEY